MAAEIRENTWESFLGQHNSLVKLLDDHAMLLVEMQGFCTENSATQNAVQKRLNTTETLIATFKLSCELLTEVTQREEQAIPEEPNLFERDIPKPTIKTQKKTKPVTDASGLFSIDPNPTPVEELLGKKKKPIIAVKAEKPQKRKAEDGDDGDTPSSNESAAQDLERVIKKLRKANERNEKDVHAPAREPEPNVDEEFIKSVEARTKAKEEKRERKLHKKRKRESGDSVAASKDVAEVPKIKRKKGQHEVGIVPTETVNGQTASASVSQAQTAPASERAEQEKPKRKIATNGETEEVDADRGAKKHKVSHSEDQGTNGNKPRRKRSARSSAKERKKT